MMVVRLGRVLYWSSWVCSLAAVGLLLFMEYVIAPSSSPPSLGVMALTSAIILVPSVLIGRACRYVFSGE